MIVVIGSPVFRSGAGSSNGLVAGLAGQVALAAAAADRTVQLVGKVGDDDAGDALLVALAQGNVGHAALLRDAAHATPLAAATVAHGDETIEDALIAHDPVDVQPTAPPPMGLPLEAADIGLALRYLTDFRVLVIAAPLDPSSLDATLDAAGFAGSHVVRLDAPGAATGAAAPDGVEVTAFEAPEHEEPAFATMVGRYAAGLDAGRSARDAFADATRAANWERAAGN